MTDSTQPLIISIIISHTVCNIISAFEVYFFINFRSFRILSVFLQTFFKPFLHQSGKPFRDYILYAWSGPYRISRNYFHFFFVSELVGDLVCCTFDVVLNF